MTITADIKSGLAFHCHHSTLYEPVYDYDERVKYILANKPINEQALRLKLFQLIPTALVPGLNSPEWEAYDNAWKAYNKAREAYDKAREACDKAWKAYDKARKAYDNDKAWKAYDNAFGKEIDALHKELCPNCPWNGKTIFS